MPARNSPSREPLSTSTSVAGSTGRGSPKRRPSQVAAAAQNSSSPLFMGYLPNSPSDRASTGPTNDGTPCCGSPTARLIGDLPGSVVPSSSRWRTNGERIASEPVGEPAEKAEEGGD